MLTIDIQYMETPAGELILGSYGGKLCLCDWRHRLKRAAIDARICRFTDSVFMERPSAVTDRAREELAGYFSGSRQDFSVPVLMAGTPFQQQVWNALLKVQFGKTETYLHLARRLNHPEAIRAVASANAANALAILIPCHRIVGQNGAMTGYSGGIQAKRILLTLERIPDYGQLLF